MAKRRYTQKTKDTIRGKFERGLPNTGPKKVGDE